MGCEIDLDGKFKFNKELPEEFKKKLEPKEPAEKKKPRRGKFTEEQWDVIDEQSIDESWIFEDDDRPQLVVV